MAGPHRVTQVDVVILYLVSYAHPNVEYELEQAVCAGVEADFNAGLEGGRAVTVRYVLPIDLAYGTAPTVKAVMASKLPRAGDSCKPGASPSTAKLAFSHTWACST